MGFVFNIFNPSGIIWVDLFHRKKRVVDEHLKWWLYVFVNSLTETCHQTKTSMKTRRSKAFPLRGDRFLFDAWEVGE